MPLNGNPVDWSTETKQGAIFAQMKDLPDRGHTGRQCSTCSATYQLLVDALGAEPLVFKSGGEPLPRGKERARRLLNLIREVHAYVGEYRPDAAPRPTPAPAAPLTNAPAVAVVSDGTCQRDAQTVIDFVQREMRPFADARNADGKPFDQVGMRPALNASKMLTRGIRPDAIKHALTMHWPSEARRALNIRDFDATTFEPREWKGVKRPTNVLDHDGTHKALPYVLALADARLPIALVGPPGTGKTHLAEDLADALDLPFGFVSMTRGTSPSAFNGRPKLASDGTAELVAALIANGRAAEALTLAEARHAEGDSVMSKFVRIFGSGGVWLYDEMDAADSNLLLMTNAALANGYFENPMTGERVQRHENFVPVAGMNTLGLGADRQMVGREKQDAAALDRWNAGRVRIELDTELERHIYWNTVAA